MGEGESSRRAGARQISLAGTVSSGGNHSIREKDPWKKSKEGMRVGRSPPIENVFRGGERTGGGFGGEKVMGQVGDIGSEGG